MLIIIHDDSAYLAWITHHRHGYVVDCKRKPTKHHLVLHRATCALIKPRKRARLTTGAKIKVCSLDVAELEAWAHEETGGGLSTCPDCQPEYQEEPGADPREKHALTRLGNDIASYVVDLAVMFLDDEAAHFRPSVADIAEYLGKTPAQIAPALERLVEDGYLVADKHLEAGKPPPNGAIIYPTANSLRSVPAFADMPADELRAELEKLSRG